MFRSKYTGKHYVIAVVVDVVAVVVTLPVTGAASVEVTLEFQESDSFFKTCSRNMLTKDIFFGLCGNLSIHKLP